MSNKRITQPSHQAAIKPDTANAYDFGASASYLIHGLQSFSCQSTPNLEQIFEVGQLAVYENIETTPDITITAQKVLDGYPLMYHLATVTATDPTLIGRSNAKCMFGWSVFPDTQNSASGTSNTVCGCSGMFVSSLSYTFPVDGNCTEDITLVGSNKVWKNQPTHGDTLASLPDPAFAGGFSGNNDTPAAAGGVSRRESVLFDGSESVSVTGYIIGLDVNGMYSGPDTTVLPPEVYGVDASGMQDMTNVDNHAHITNITVSADLSREALNEVGLRAPYHRSITFPVEITTEIEVTAVSGDMVSLTEDGVYTTGEGACSDLGNTKDRTIRIATCDGTRIYTGLKNRISNTNQQGGDAGGGNVTITYTFTTQNDLTVLHENDPNALGSTWWEDRYAYLGTADARCDTYSIVLDTTGLLYNIPYGLTLVIDEQANGLNGTYHLTYANTGTGEITYTGNDQNGNTCVLFLDYDSGSMGATLTFSGAASYGPAPVGTAFSGGSDPVRDFDTLDLSFEGIEIGNFEDIVFTRACS